MSTTSDDRLVAGSPVDGEPELVAFVAALRAAAQDAPRPTPALEAVLRDGLAQP
ncbi:hypothetical protein ICW40_17005, partial [Actinotalea ferrariae]|nr:hypothetical protein [Actinotalea ferrariae]